MLKSSQIKKMKKIARKSFESGNEMSLVSCKDGEESFVETGGSMGVDSFRNADCNKINLQFHTHISGKGAIPTVPDIELLYERDKNVEYYAVGGLTDKKISIWKKKKNAKSKEKYRGAVDYFKRAFKKGEEVLIGNGEIKGENWEKD